ncbi:MAG: hypothetical protein ACTTKN_06445 [Phocaeicola sp.]|uniref:hypothetical protein n=1 Tax=Phocaeicola sp. TaxID=2773926 RepID=UPI003F9F6CB2
MRKESIDREDFTIRASIEALIDSEQALYASRCPEIVNELDDTSSLWLSLQPPYTPSQSRSRHFLELEEEPYFRLAGLLELTYRNSTPSELQTQGLTIRIRDNKAHFCISGSISLDDLQKLCERYRDGQYPDQCKK